MKHTTKRSVNPRIAQFMDWNKLPHNVCSTTLSFLDVPESLNLNSAMTNHEMRPLFVELHKDLCCPAFDKYGYTDEEDYRSLQWGLCFGQMEGESRSGPVLVRMMTCDHVDEIMYAIMYYVTRGQAGALG